MKVILLIVNILFLQHCNNKDLTLTSNYLSEQIYICQIKSCPEEITPFLRKRVDKLKNVRNKVFECHQIVSVNNSDTLFLIEDFNNNFIAGQIWTSSGYEIKYRVNLNKSDSVSYFNKNIFSKELVLLIKNWDLKGIKKNENNGIVTLPVSQCYITRILIERNKIKDIKCFCFNLNF